MKKLFIFPYNGNGIEALDCIGSEFEFLGFIDDTPEKLGRNQFGHMVYPRTELQNVKDAFVLAVPGSPTSYKVRKKIIEQLDLDPERFATVIHPKASVSSLARLGKNVLIMAGSVVTSNAVIGDHVCILPNTVVHHDVTIGHYTLLGSNITIAGNTKVGDNCYIGSGTRVINNISIGDGTLVGLGTNVIRDLPPDVKAVGNPARIL